VAVLLRSGRTTGARRAVAALRRRAVGEVLHRHLDRVGRVGRPAVPRRIPLSLPPTAPTELVTRVPLGSMTTP
jgi:hypothetical protein